MFLYIQKKMNIIFISLFIILSGLLYFTYDTIIKYTTWGFMGIIAIFILIIMLMHLLIHFIQTHIEVYTIYKLISKEKIALAKINHVEYHKMTKDIFFKPHYIYKMYITIFTQDNKKIDYAIYEDVANNNFSCLPAYVYVTYDNKHKKIGIVPTFVLFMTPKLKKIVKDYEKKYKPNYVEVSKKDGLSFKMFNQK